MSIAKLAAFLLAVALLRAHIANLPVTGASPVPLIIDFGFPAILLSDSSFTCSDSTGCKFIDQNDQQGTYRGSKYSFRHATLNLKIGANAYDLPVQINSNKLDVFGISLQTEYAAALEGKAGLAIGLNGGAILEADSAGAVSRTDDFDFTFDPTQGFFYISSLLKYELWVQQPPDDIHPVVQNPVRLCLQPDTPVASANYFFLSNAAFALDWDAFLQQIYWVSFLAKKLEYNVLLGVDSQQPSSVSYDYKIFESYDGQPFKIGKDELLKGFCEIYAGDFFAQRAGLTVKLTKTPGQANLVVKGNVNEMPYEVYFSINWRLFLNLVLWFSALVMMVLCCCPGCTGINFKEPKPDRLLA